MTAAAALGALADLRAEADACRRLWGAVVARAIMDADRPDHDGASARSWLRAPDEFVLEASGLDPDAARVALIRLAGQGVGM